jgi:glycosyltransferase involved in cell wall biosynthesis
VKTICFTVTNDLVHDQRMIRICGSLAEAGYQVTLVGRQLKGSAQLAQTPYHQHRIRCAFHKGFLFYAEFNLRLFCWLLAQKTDIICAIDLDTILPCYFLSRVKKIPRVFDAHELFCEMKEVARRPLVKWVWTAIEKYCVPRFENGYTVSSMIAEHYHKAYGVSYSVVRNMPLDQQHHLLSNRGRFILYQGAVNEGRCFEQLIPAMKWVQMPLHIYGDGNFVEQVRKLIRTNGLEDRVFLKGKLLPVDLPPLTRTAFIGISLFDGSVMHNRYSLANRFFDFILAGVPQICSNFQAYRELNDQYGVALMVDEHSSVNIASSLNKLIENEFLHSKMVENCLVAARVLNWQKEVGSLLDCYKKLKNLEETFSLSMPGCTVSSRIRRSE